MSQSPQQAARPSVGRYEQGTWYCKCGLEAKRYTSNTNATRGQKFLRCPRSSAVACKFFLWENDEVEARQTSASQSDSQYLQGPVSPPRTPDTALKIKPFPASPGLSQSLTPPSASTGNRTDDDDLTYPRMAPIHHRNSNGSRKNTPPIPIHRPNISTSSLPSVFADDAVIDSTNLTSDVISLLRSKNVTFKESTDVQLRSILDIAVAVYETKLRMYEEMIQKLCARLDRLEVAAGDGEGERA